MPKHLRHTLSKRTNSITVTAVEYQTNETKWIRNSSERSIHFPFLSSFALTHRSSLFFKVPPHFPSLPWHFWSALHGYCSTFHSNEVIQAVSNLHEPYNTSIKFCRLNWELRADIGTHLLRTNPFRPSQMIRLTYGQTLGVSKIPNMSQTVCFIAPTVTICSWIKVDWISGCVGTRLVVYLSTPMHQFVRSLANSSMYKGDDVLIQVKPREDWLERSVRTTPTFVLVALLATTKQQNHTTVGHCFKEGDRIWRIQVGSVRRCTCR